MNKTQAISRIGEAKDTDDIVVASFPCNICEVCGQPKDVLFVNFFADRIQEACGACSVKLRQLEKICNELTPEQEALLLQKVR